MCEVLDRIEKRGIEQGIERGIEQGIATNLCRNVEALMKNMKLSLRDACLALSITVEDYRAAKG